MRKCANGSSGIVSASRYRLKIRERAPGRNKHPAPLRLAANGIICQGNDCQGNEDQKDSYSPDPHSSHYVLCLRFTSENVFRLKVRAEGKVFCFQRPAMCPATKTPGKGRAHVRKKGRCSISSTG